MNFAINLSIAALLSYIPVVGIALAMPFFIGALGALAATVLDIINVFPKQTFMFQLLNTISEGLVRQPGAELPSKPPEPTKGYSFWGEVKEAGSKTLGKFVCVGECSGAVLKLPLGEVIFEPPMYPALPYGAIATTVVYYQYNWPPDISAKIIKVCQIKSF